VRPMSSAPRAAVLLLLALRAAPVSAGSEPPAAADATVTNGAVSVEPAQPAPPSPAAPEPPDAFYAIPTRLDRIGRIVIPIRVNGQGPFQFVLDTGANATVISPHLATALGLHVDPARTLLMSGVTGSISVPTASVDEIDARGLTLVRQQLAVSEATAVGTDGILGVDALKSKAVLVDFNNDRVEVLDARKHPPSDELGRIPAKLRFGNLLIVDALIGPHKVKAVIDTGGQRTLGNPALYAMLGYQHENPSREAAADVIGATNARQPGERHIVRSVTMGDLRIANLTVTFGDFYIFKRWELDSQPALVIGMDMIGTLGIFGVDYVRCEVQIKAGQQLRRRRGPSS
jgi:predicted aspartyl protease